MARQVQLRRGTTAEHSSFTGVEGEMTVDTDKDTLVVHDGSTAGGIPIAKASQSRGYTLLEHFTSNGTWTKTGKTGLKRILVHAFGGGGGGANQSGGSGGGSGGHGFVMLEEGDVTTNVAVTIGAGGTTTVNGGSTTFGSYITANGGVGPGNANYGGGAIGGNATGTGVIN